MEQSPQPAFNHALDRLWIQFLPQLEERVSALEAAGSALAAGGLSIGLKGDANSAAHKLAGVLGTFGLTRGTDLAREAESIYADGLETDPLMAARLRKIAAELRAIVIARATSPRQYTD